VDSDESCIAKSIRIQSVISAVCNCSHCDRLAAWRRLRFTSVFSSWSWTRPVAMYAERRRRRYKSAQWDDCLLDWYASRDEVPFRDVSDRWPHYLYVYIGHTGLVVSLVLATDCHICSFSDTSPVTSAHPGHQLLCCRRRHLVGGCQQLQCSSVMQYWGAGAYFCCRFKFR